MKKYRAVFSMEFESENWERATKEFELQLKVIKGLYDVKGKLLEEIDGDD